MKGIKFHLSWFSKEENFQMGVVYSHIFQNLQQMHLCSADRYEEDKLLPFKGALFSQISQHQRHSHFTTPETDVVVMMMMMMICTYAHHYLGEYFGDLIFWDPVLLMRYYSESLVLMKEICIWESIVFLLLTSNLILEKKINNLNLFPSCFLFLEERLFILWVLMIFGKLNAILIKKKIILEKDEK